MCVSLKWRLLLLWFAVLSLKRKKGRWIDILIFETSLNLWAQDVNLTYIKRSEEVQDDFGTCYVPSVDVQCPGCSWHTLNSEFYNERDGEKIQEKASSLVNIFELDASKQFFTKTFRLLSESIWRMPKKKRKSVES